MRDGWVWPAAVPLLLRSWRDQDPHCVSIPLTSSLQQVAHAQGFICFSVSHFLHWNKPSQTSHWSIFTPLSLGDRGLGSHPQILIARGGVRAPQMVREWPLDKGSFPSALLSVIFHPHGIADAGWLPGVLTHLFWGQAQVAVSYRLYWRP